LTDRQPTIMEFFQELKDMRRKLDRMESSTAFYARRTHELEEKTAQYQQILEQLANQVSLKPKSLTSHEIERKFNRFFQPVLEALLHLWRLSKFSPYGVHKREVARALQVKLKHPIAETTIYRRCEYLSDRRVFDPPLALRVARGRYIVNLKALEKRR